MKMFSVKSLIFSFILANTNLINAEDTGGDVRELPIYLIFYYINNFLIISILLWKQRTVRCEVPSAQQSTRIHPTLLLEESLMQNHRQAN